nr:tachylectin-related carbohydrate-binding protein [Bradyrhizobium tropiciagri]
MNGAAWAPNSGAVILKGVPSGQLFAGSDGVLYVLTPSGQILWYRDVANNGTSGWDPNSGNVIGTVELPQYAQVVLGGDGVMYAIDKSNNLFWFKNWTDNGTTPAWSAAKSASNIWPGFWQSSYRSLIPGGDGVLYVLDSAGNLHWFRDAANNGTVSHDPNSGLVIASGLTVTPLASGMLPVWAGENGTIYSLSGQTLQSQQLAISVDGIPSVATTPGPQWTAAAVSAVSPVTPTNVGCGIVNLCNEKTGSNIAYPVFTGDQLTCYQDVNAQVGKAYSATNFDLRSAYANPDAYPPSGLLALVTAAKPSQGETASDWTAVQSQLEAETAQLNAIYAYQTDARTNASALAITYLSSYQIAAGCIDGKADLTMDVLSVLSYLAIPEVPESGFFCQMAGLIAALIQASGDTVMSGKFSEMNLGNTVTGLLDQVSALYSGLQSDWGKVQKANQILQNAIATPAGVSYQQMGYEYEAAMYIAYALKDMCVLYATQYKAFGPCGGDGVGLANIPLENAPYGVNPGICSRLPVIGISQQDVIGRVGQWAKLQKWECMFIEGTSGGWNCIQE